MLGVIIDVIIPTGTTSKYISGIFAIFVLFVMVNPIITFLKSDYKLSDYFNNIEIELNHNLLHSFTTSKFDAIESEIEQQLLEQGYSNVDLDIKFTIYADNVEIKQVLVDLTNLVINTNSENINKYVHIRQVVMENILVGEEVIEFCE